MFPLFNIEFDFGPKSAGPDSLRRGRYLLSRSQDQAKTPPTCPRLCQSPCFLGLHCVGADVDQWPGGRNSNNYHNLVFKAIL